MAARAAGDDGVTYVATIWREGAPDADLDARVAAHRSRRPESWVTVEPPYDLDEVLTTTQGVLLVDSLGSWLTAQPAMAVDSEVLVRALSGRAGDTVVVSDEVGLGVHPETELGRQFRDALGRLNSTVADVADDVFLVVAGRLLRLDRP